MSVIKSERVAWYMYDWAVSAFTTSVLTVFIGPYLTTVTKNAAINGFVNVFGISIFADSFYSYIISLSVFLQVLVLPFVGTVADNSGKKKLLFALFTVIGSVAAILLYFLNGTNFLFGGLMVLISNLACGSAMVLYNAFLKQVADENERNQVSSNGFAIGYIGGGILLALNLVLVMNAEKLGITVGHAVRISLFSAGLWWLVFALIPIKYLKESKNSNNIKLSDFRMSFSKLIETVKELKLYPKTMLFLIAYLLFNDGVQSVIVVSSQFGQEALKLSISTLTTVILIVQFVAFFGARIFGYLADKFNAKRALILSLFIWIGVLIYSYMWLNSEFGFYILGAVIGLVLGGTQALSRSIYSLVIPNGKEAEYFSIYEISERGTSWLGPLLFGLSLQFTSNYKFAILSLIVFFIVGCVLLFRFKFKEAIIESGNVAPASII